MHLNYFFHNQTTTSTSTTTSTTTTSSTTVITTPTTATTTSLFANTTVKTGSVIGSFNNVSSAQLNQILQNAVGSITGCLLSCSNQGSCTYDLVTKQIGCVCNQYFTGSSCEYDSRPCSSNPCLYGGICSNNEAAFSCACQSVYYGTFCENQLNLCLNSSCVSGQSKCVQNGSQALCECFKGYTGLNCESLTHSLKVTKAFISFASILAFIVLGSFVFCVILMDYLKYCVIKDKRRMKERGFKEKLNKIGKEHDERKSVENFKGKNKFYK
jgi:hypothetical protein